MRALWRRQYFQKSTFILYSKLLPQIFQTNMVSFYRFPKYEYDLENDFGGDIFSGDACFLAVQDSSIGDLVTQWVSE